MMFKMVGFLCAAIFVTLQFGAREDGALRDGLAGRIAPLTFVATDAPVLRATAPAEPAEEPATPVVPATYVAPEPPAAQSPEGLTLALPLVEAGAAEPAAGPVPTAPDEPVVLYVIGSTVNVRQGPSADSESLARLARGEAVQVLPSDTPGWSMIRIEGDGVEGYIASRFLGDAPQDGLFTAD